MKESVWALLNEVSTEWNRIEKRAKEAESFRGEAIVASINEMRYAGRRIVDAVALLQSNNPDEIMVARDHIVIAKTYLMNADHDLTDSVIFIAHTRFIDVEKRHKIKKIKKYIPEYEQFYQSIKEAQKIVQGSREDRSKRADAYRTLADEYIPKLMDIHHKINSCQQLYVSREDLLEKNVKLVAWIALVGSVASIIGVALAIWGIWLSWP